MTIKLLTKAEWTEVVQEFRNSNNHTVNYIVRCFAVGDEEETQVYDFDEEKFEIDPPDNVSESTWDAVCKVLKTKPGRHEANDNVISLLKPYITRKDLFEQHDGHWEQLFWNAWDEKSTYDDYIVYMEDCYTDAIRDN